MYKLKPNENRIKLVIPEEQLLDAAEIAGKWGKSRKCGMEKLLLENEQKHPKMSSSAFSWQQPFAFLNSQFSDRDKYSDPRIL